MNVNTSTGQVMLTKTLPTTDSGLLPFVVRFESNTAAKSEGDAYQIKFYDGTYLPWQSAGYANYVTTSKGYNGSNNEGYLPVYDTDHFYFQVYKGGTSRKYYFNGNEFTNGTGGFTFWDNTKDNSKYQIYEVTCDNFQEVEYNFSISTSTTSNVTRKLLTVKNATAAIPTTTASGYVFPYTTIVAPTASSDGSAISFSLTENYPFLTTTLVAGEIPASAPLYRLKGNAGSTAKYVERNSSNQLVYKNDGNVDTDDYFCFTGNIISGFRIYNVGAGTSVNLGMDTQPQTNDVPTFTSTDHVWRLFANSSNFGLQQKTAGETSLSNAYLCNTAKTGMSYWVSSSAESTNDTGAQFQCERVSFDVIDETYVRVGSGEYELVSSVSQTYNSGDAYVQNIHSSTSTGITLTNDRVDDAPSYVNENATVKYYYTSESAPTFPFKLTTIENGEFVNPTWYYMTVNNYPAYTTSSGKMLVDNTNGPLLHERWCFVGDIVNGIRIYSETNGTMAPLRISKYANNDNVVMDGQTTNSLWQVQGTWLSSLNFKQINNSSTFALNQLGGASGGSGWNWKIGLWSSGSNIALTEATDAVAETYLEDAYSLIQSNEVYTNNNHLGYPTEAAYNSLNAILIQSGTPPYTANKYAAMLQGWIYYYYNAPRTMPQSGNFYRIKGATSQRYLTCEASATNSDRLAASTTAGANTIFYYSGKKLLGYCNGLYTVSTCEQGNVGATGQEYTIMCTDFGVFSIKGGGYLYSHTADNKLYFDRNGDTFADECRMQIENVTSLPVTISKYGMRTFSAPVALTIPEGVQAFTVAVSGSDVVLTEVTTTIPANTPVVLYSHGVVWENDVVTGSDETFNFTIASANTDEPLTCELTPIIATRAKTDNDLTLQYDLTNKVFGFWKATGANIKGFSAYLEWNDSYGAVRSFVISMPYTTGIEMVSENPLAGRNIYDVQGRQVNKATKGLYIVNGKKVLF